MAGKAQKTLEERFYVDNTSAVTPAYWNRFLAEVGVRFRALDQIKLDWDEVSSQGIEVALNRINEVLTPLAEQLRDMAELGFLTASSESTVAVVEGQVAELIIQEGTQRDLFTPSPFVALTRRSTVADYAVCRLNFYDAETGQLSVIVDSVTGNGGPHSDWDASAVAGSVMAQVDMLDQGIAARDTAVAARDTAVAAKGTAVAARDAAVSAKDDAQAAKAQIDAVWYGARATPPAGAALGSQFLDTSQTPNVVKVLTDSGWAPTVTVSVGGSRQQVYIATAGQTGPFVVDGGFDAGHVTVNGVAMYDGHGVTLDEVEGEFTLATALEAGDVVAFSGYKQNDAVDIYTKQETDARFVGIAGAGILSGFRNKIINGDLTGTIPGFPINQRNHATPLTPGIGVYGYDRWKGHADGLEQVCEGLEAGEYTLTWTGGGGGRLDGGALLPSPIKATVSAGNVSVVVPTTAGRVSLVKGDATAEADPFSPRHIQQELALCQRYYEERSSRRYLVGAAWNTVGSIVVREAFNVPKRAIPTVTLSNGETGLNTVWTSRTVQFPETTHDDIAWTLQFGGATSEYDAVVCSAFWTADAEL